jgi:hypothetical protein
MSALVRVDPVDYQDALAEGVDALSAARVNVSVYTLFWMRSNHAFFYGMTEVAAGFAHPRAKLRCRTRRL